MNIINLVQSPGYKCLLVQRKQQWKMASPVWSMYLGAPYWGETSVTDFDKQRWREQCCRTLRSLRRVRSMNTDHRAGLYILYDGSHLHDNICWMLNVLSLNLPSDWREWSCFFPSSSWSADPISAERQTYLDVCGSGGHFLPCQIILKSQPSALIQLQSQQTVIIGTWLWHVVIIHSAIWCVLS